MTAPTVDVNASTAVTIDTPGVTITDTTASSTTEGGSLRLVSNDGATMAQNHRLGVLEFAGAEDSSNTITVGARIEATCEENWTATENGTSLSFYTTDADASQSEVLKLDSNKVATIAGSASGTDALVITAGDILVNSGHIDMTEGDLTLTDGSVTVTDADNATSLSVTNNTITTANLITVASSSITTGALMSVTGKSATANNITAFSPIYNTINGVNKGMVKFTWNASTAASEVDTGVDLPFTTGVCVVTDIYIITTNATNTPTIDIGLLSSEQNGDADGFLDGVTQGSTGVQSTYTDAFKGVFNTDGGDNVPTRWNCPFDASTGQARSISMTLSATGSAGTVIMEYIAMDV